MPSLDLTPEFFTPVLSAWASREEQEWADWRGRRLASLHAAHGWLTLTSYEWVPAESSRLESVPGLWSVRDGAVLISPDPDASGILRSTDGSPFVAGSLRLEEGESDIIGQFEASERPYEAVFRNGSRRLVDRGLIQVEVGVRGGRYMVRTRGPEPELAKVPTYPYDRKWIVSALFEPSPAPYTENVASAREDTAVQMTLAGTVRFRIPGHPEDVVAAVEANGSAEGRSTFALTFKDKTNGKTTPAWRFVSVLVYGEPGENGWEPGSYNAVIDFNRTLNYPMAFSPYAVCPAPPLGNTIDAPVTAGEQALPSV